MSADLWRAVLNLSRNRPKLSDDMSLGYLACSDQTMPPTKIGYPPDSKDTIIKYIQPHPKLEKDADIC